MKDSEMLIAIAQYPIVSTDTLRPDHLCSALIREADRLEIELDRDLWQPAAAIAAHGKRGIVLELPPRLQEISLEIVSELFDALNWAAPGGCSLGASEGDGACFLWTLTIEAQAEAINADPTSGFEAKTLEIPSHWMSAVVNGDETSFDYYDDLADYRAYQAFCRDELSDGWQIAGYENEGNCGVVECLAMRPRPAAVAA